MFTGKVCYVFRQNRSYALGLSLIWLGNVVGTGIVAKTILATRLSSLSGKAQTPCQTRLEDGLGSLFVLGILCNIFIYIAVEGFKNNPHQLGKYLSLFFGGMVFILCGYEHCVADMFYFFAARAWSVRAIVCILMISAGNAVGGVILPLARCCSASAATGVLFSFFCGTCHKKEEHMRILNTKRLTIDAMLAALCAVLGYISLDLGNLKTTFESLLILLDGLLIGAIGTFIYQFCAVVLRRLRRCGFCHM